MNVESSCTDLHDDPSVRGTVLVVRDVRERKAFEERLHHAAFHDALTRLVYGRPDPRPGNFAPLYRSTDDFLTIINDVTGQDYGWFFRGYLYNAALPMLTQNRDGGALKLEWTTGDGGVFPMPLEVEIDGRVQTVAMTGGRGQIAVPAGAHVLIDPQNKVLRQMDVIDELQAYKAAQKAAH